jgi:hypothetical protein
MSEAKTDFAIFGRTKLFFLMISWNKKIDEHSVGLSYLPTWLLSSNNTVRTSCQLLLMVLIASAVIGLGAGYFYGHAISSVAGGILNLRAGSGCDQRTASLDGEGPPES